MNENYRGSILTERARNIPEASPADPKSGWHYRL